MSRWAGGWGRGALDGLPGSPKKKARSAHSIDGGGCQHMHQPENTSKRSTALASVLDRTSLRDGATEWAHTQRECEHGHRGAVQMPPRFEGPLPLTGLGRGHLGRHLHLGGSHGCFVRRKKGLRCDADSVGLLGALLSGPYYVRTVLAARTCKLARTAEGTPVQVHPAGMNRSR